MRKHEIANNDGHFASVAKRIQMRKKTVCELANRRFRPLSHLSVYPAKSSRTACTKVAHSRTSFTPCNTYSTRSRTETNQSRKPRQGESWPRKVQPGRAIVTVSRRKTPTGNPADMNCRSRFNQPPLKSVFSMACNNSWAQKKRFLFLPVISLTILSFSSFLKPFCAAL